MFQFERFPARFRCVELSLYPCLPFLNLLSCYNKQIFNIVATKLDLAGALAEASDHHPDSTTQTAG